MADQRRTGLSIGNQALIGLLAGLPVGAMIAASASPTLLAFGSAVEVVGTLWINAILMTIVPLVVSKVIVSIAGAQDPRTVGRAGWRAGVLFLALLTVTAMTAIAVMPAVFVRLPIDPAAAAALRAGLPPRAANGAPSAAQTVLALVPTNAIRAAADGAIVPLLVFAAAFAFGASRIQPALRDHLVAFFRAIDAAITVLLHWIIACAPYGVFALGVGLAIKVGVGIVGALVYYVVVSTVSIVIITAALYVVVWAGVRVSPRRFARAAAPAQVVAFGTHSSMAALPAMIAGAEERLGLSQTATGFVLPLSLAVFKYSGPVWFVVVACFVGRLYDIPIDPSRFVGIVLTAVLTSFAVGGVPSGAVVVAAPVLAAAGLPVEAIGLLLAVDPLPNAFRTVANVTGMLAVTALAGGPASKHEQP
jgi:Na+/H+-dicarboxylate symporter